MTITAQQRQQVVTTAQWLGLSNFYYDFGGDGYNGRGLDCSGLAMRAWDGIVDLPHNADQQTRAAHVQFVPSSSANLQRLLPGDLVFYNRDERGVIGHVGVYLYYAGGMWVIAQATDTAHGSEVIKMRKYVDPVGFGLVR